MLELPKRDRRSRAATASCMTTCRMWKYWCLEEGTLGVDPNMHKTNDGRLPPVIHVDTDAPLYSDVDGTLITDKLWGLYYKPDFNFGGIQGGASPYKVEQDPDERRGRSLRPGIARFHRRRQFRRDLVLDAGALPEALRRQDRASTSSEEKSGGLGCFTPDNFPVFDVVPRECLRDRRLQPRLQDDRRRQARGAGDAGREERAARAVPLLALRRRASCIRRRTARFRGAEAYRRAGDCEARVCGRRQSQ